MFQKTDDSDSGLFVSRNWSVMECSVTRALLVASWEGTSGSQEGVQSWGGGETSYKAAGASPPVTTRQHRNPGPGASAELCLQGWPGGVTFEKEVAG